MPGRKTQTSDIATAKEIVEQRLLAIYRLMHPGNLFRRARIYTRGRGETRTVFFVPHNRNNVRLLAEAAEILTRQGVRCVFAHLDGLKRGGVARPELEARGLRYIDFAELERVIRPGDMMVTGNDYAPQFFRRFIDSINFGMVRVVGYIGGARLVQPHRFFRADYILAMGPAALRQRYQPTYVVGSPVIERAIKNAGARHPEGLFVLVNFKGEIDNSSDRESLEAVAAACAELGLAYVISVHPTMFAKVEMPNKSNLDFAQLLPDALVLVTRPSTTVYEAIACGIPVVLFPPVSPMVEFDRPEGAFKPNSSRHDLVKDIRAAVRGRPSYFEQGQRFLNANLSIDPKTPAAQRIADALLHIYNR
ncbi:hypothetical protein [Mesorhizobium atlanticum]|uniref:UDP-N-acetylglucosamine 2-epimerase domain-containing protein n=1 Tax=Mesorhizobium atlanticum TaxID=2233532 RepID=A0A330GY70_9HYPH|nr:hypothetical protein [Mesorhizobium atlanticum]RAZ77255.1 hypothetical protein DPM35_12285 [Mesorhizobium atlanticum]